MIIIDQRKNGFLLFSICVYFIVNEAIFKLYYTNLQCVIICLLYKGLRSVGSD
jgi:hypothetical protein